MSKTLVFQVLYLNFYLKCILSLVSTISIVFGCNTWNPLRSQVTCHRKNWLLWWTSPCPWPITWAWWRRQFLGQKKVEHVRYERNNKNKQTDSQTTNRQITIKIERNKRGNKQYTNNNEQANNKETLKNAKTLKTKLLHFEWSPPWHHIDTYLSQILTFFVLKSGEDEKERIILMKSRGLRPLDFIRIILSSSSLLLVRDPAVTTVIYLAKLIQTDSRYAWFQRISDARASPDA